MAIFKSAHVMFRLTLMLLLAHASSGVAQLHAEQQTSAQADSSGTQILPEDQAAEQAVLSIKHDLAKQNVELAQKEARLMAELGGDSADQAVAEPRLTTNSNALNSAPEFGKAQKGSAAEPAQEPKSIIQTKDSHSAAMRPADSVIEQAHSTAAESKQQSVGSVQTSPAKLVKANNSAAAVKKPSDEEKSAMLSSMQKSNLELAQKLRLKDSRIELLERELGETRNRLILAETEVERISHQLDSRNRASLSGLVDKDRALSSGPKASMAAPRVAAAPAPLPEVDMQIATVVADKAALRTGPGMENSPLMEVTRGTRLTVEKRDGNWYRVNTPNGTRAWVRSDMLDFGASANASGMSRKRGYDAGNEEALGLIRNSN